MRRFALLALLLSTSSVVAAPAPLPKPQRKVEQKPVVVREFIYVIDGGSLGGIGQPAPPVPPPPPAQPPNADPPG